ncbi:cupin domain-containing protein [Paraburkholderia sp. DHOC27]|uniref:cupin domain-containing protein n=1 Tax=Paraburkholderia sp. DHOC27 TaxID=2303330 RepID=UPI000E3D5F98|nr:cupin domain-containing protein [Paraburkholderia sp. DHOC27]RFU49269.1 cupin domain-containing protein [Paraburkholderia sp. DHOC27]
MNSNAVESGPATCRVVQPGSEFEGKQGLTYAVGISAESVGSKFVHLQLATIPPGARAKAHLHAQHETAIYQLSGVSGCWYGDRLEHHAVVRAGDFFYIPAGVPHVPYNPSADEPCVAVIARTDPNEQESVTMRPDLDALPDWASVTPLSR